MKAHTVSSDLDLATAQSKEAVAPDLDSAGEVNKSSLDLSWCRGTRQPEMRQTSRFGPEIIAALAASVLMAFLLAQTAVSSGPLWRDEVNTANVAQTPSLRELWSSLRFESFPPLWPLVLRGWTFLGFGSSDAGIRCLGALVGVLFLVSLWLCARWTSRRAPMLSLALLSSLPAIYFTVISNRAYGLGMCLLVLTFAAIWRTLESPSIARALVAGLVSVFFLHCVYYDVVFLGAMLLAGTIVCVRQQQWRTLLALVAIGLVAGASMIIYLPVIRGGSAYAQMIRAAAFGPGLLWSKLGDAVAARGSAQPPGPPGPEIWVLAALVGSAIAAGLALQARRNRITGSGQRTSAEAEMPPRQADLALFSVISLVCGTAAFLGFLLALRYPTQKWYYVEMLSLIAVTLDCIFSLKWPVLRPWGWARIVLLAAAILWSSGSVWEESRTRRSNVDSIAAFLEHRATDKDLIIVYTAWEGITFERYYHGNAQWISVPPLGSHKVHRNDLMLEAIHQRDPMAAVLSAATEALRTGNHVWVVGRATTRPEENLGATPKVRSSPSATPRMGPYLAQWGAQLTAHLMSCAEKMRVVDVRSSVPVNFWEDLPLTEFSGYRPGDN